MDHVNLGPRCKYCERWTVLVQFSPRLLNPKGMTVCEYCDGDAAARIKAAK